MKAVFRNETVKKFALKRVLRIAAVILLVLAIIIVPKLFRGKYDPEQLVRKAVFDEYNTVEELDGIIFGGAVWNLTKDSWVYTSESECRWMWTESWKLNGEINHFEKITAIYPFDPEKEDLLCVTVSEHFDDEDDTAAIYSCVFAVNKSKRTVSPIMFIEVVNGEIVNELKADAENAVREFYSVLNEGKDRAAQQRETVYLQFNKNKKVRSPVGEIDPESGFKKYRGN